MTLHDHDPFDLARFLSAQAGTIESALEELRAGRKRTHWMWFVFPQLRGLGSSPMAERYALRSRAEAEAYLGHPVLGSRLRACAEALLGVQDRSAREILGQPDDLKLHSSMTLFATVAPAEPRFTQVLERYYAGAPDERTVALLAASESRTC